MNNVVGPKFTQKFEFFVVWLSREQCRETQPKIQNTTSVGRKIIAEMQNATSVGRNFNLDTAYFAETEKLLMKVL